MPMSSCHTDQNLEDFGPLSSSAVPFLLSPGCDRQVQPHRCSSSEAIKEELQILLRPWRRLLIQFEWLLSADPCSGLPSRPYTNWRNLLTPHANLSLCGLLTPPQPQRNNQK
ncbi:hypothetical protein ATANTOWER_013146 [Ataeniobius toweri]|uniref:Uncharacterized protein n=1 Tax=Ataeniobius toweri TaxID=208326 RepID=A0ABU7A616_9TELE|nr:hypothetical protein [Ataeniobius toweri]